MINFWQIILFIYLFVHVFIWSKIPPPNIWGRNLKLFTEISSSPKISLPPLRNSDLRQQVRETPTSKPIVSQWTWIEPCPPFTCTHPFQPQTLARTLSTKSPNLSTLALFWILNSLCTSQLWKPHTVLPRVRTILYLTLTRSVMTRTLLNLPHTKPRSVESNSITPLYPEPALHSQWHRHQRKTN